MSGMDCSDLLMPSIGAHVMFEADVKFLTPASKKWERRPVQVKAFENGFTVVFVPLGPVLNLTF